MRLIGFIIILTGLLILVVGYGMWESPELDWNGVLNVLSEAVSTISNVGYQLLSAAYSAIIKIMNDPFSGDGLVIMAVGIGIVAVGIKSILP
jgi:hypothetical protein